MKLFVTEPSLFATALVLRVMRSARPVSRGRTAAAAAVLTALCLTATACGSSDAGGSNSSSAVSTPHAQKIDVKGPLKAATTFAKIDYAPRDTAPDATTDGTVVHPRSVQLIYTAPDGTAFAKLPVKQLGNPTWVPVIDRRDGWLHVLLPSRPDGSTGWIKDGAKLDTAHTSSVIRVDVDARRLTLTKDGRQVGRWTVAVGKKQTPTPRGRTFLMASIIDAKQAKYTPIVLPLGTHSQTLDTFGGGPGTVAMHGWTTDPSVFGHAVSNGCIRVPTAALTKLRQVPLGSLVLIR